MTLSLPAFLGESNSTLPRQRKKSSLRQTMCEHYKVRFSTRSKRIVFRLYFSSETRRRQLAVRTCRKADSISCTSTPNANAVRNEQIGLARIDEACSGHT